MWWDDIETDQLMGRLVKVGDDPTWSHGPRLGTQVLWNSIFVWARQAAGRGRGPPPDPPELMRPHSALLLP